MRKLRHDWKVARFDEVIERFEGREIILDNTQVYNCVGVRWYGCGAFVRESLLGLNISRKQQWIIREGDIVYNKLFAWKGAFAIADKLVDGCIVSDKFPLYRLDDKRVNPNYLRYFFRTPGIATQAEALSKGAAAISKLTLNPPQFWDLTLPLPPLDEQVRIVERIDRVFSRLKEAENLVAESDELFRSLSSSFTMNSFSRHSKTMTTVEEVVGRANLKNGLSVKSDGLASPVRCLRLSAMRNGQIDSSDSKPVAIPEAQATPYLARPGDVFIVRGNGSKELVGQAGMMRTEGHVEGTIFPDLFIRVPLDSRTILPAFFVAWWNSPQMRERIQSAAKTTSGIWKINQGHIASFPLPIPPIEEQVRVLSEVNGYSNRAVGLRRLREETRAELRAVMPSILNQAFSGQL